MASRPVGPVTMKFMVRDPGASRTPLADRAYTVIQDQLIMLDIRPHAAIVEGELAEQLGVGRTPVREALKRLEAERLVVSYPRRGTFATGVDVEDLGHISEIRAHLEPVAAVSLRRVVRTHSVVHELPTAVSVRGFAAIGIDGDRQAARGMVRSMLVQLCTFHGPDQVQVALVCGPDTAHGHRPGEERHPCGGGIAPVVPTGATDRRQGGCAEPRYAGPREHAFP